MGAKDILAQIALAFVAGSIIATPYAWNIIQPTRQINNAIVTSGVKYTSNKGIIYRVRLKGEEKPLIIEAKECEVPKIGKTIDALVVREAYFSNEIDCLYTR